MAVPVFIVLRFNQKRKRITLPWALRQLPQRQEPLQP
jgi:hypothetical protein